VTRPGRSSRGRQRDPLEVVLAILRRADEPLAVATIKDGMRAGGVPDIDRVWKRVQPKLAAHDSVTRVDGRYGWTDRPRPLAPAEALELVARGHLDKARRAELLELVRAALGTPTVDLEEEGRREQAEIDAVRSLAELASEVEELAVNEARTETMIHRVRARVKRSGLEPIDRAGEETTFDRKRHKPISGSIRDGASVLIVRPGYVWKAPTKDVLIAKAIVEE